MVKEQTYYNSSDALAWLRDALAMASAQKLRALLETKHLYQREGIEFPELAATVRAKVIETHRSSLDKLIQQLGSASLQIATRQRGVLESLSNRRSQAAEASDPIEFTAPNVKLYCGLCKEREAFAAIEVSQGGGIKLGIQYHVNDNEALWQIFYLTYQCQRCFGIPEGFIVRRKNWTLSLDGRSPMENTYPPKHLPKAEAKYFAEAVIARNAGKTLAAMLYLRIFIEQFGRRMTGEFGRVDGDELLNKYSKTLPPEHRDYMPSLREWYEKLSIALHTANEDEALLENALKEIERHFRIREVYEIAEVGGKS